MNMDTFPRARDSRIVVQDIDGGEVLVYDLDTNQAFCLNATASRVWRLCDGTNDRSDMARALDHRGSENTAEIVELALDLLSSNSLLENTSFVRTSTASRRETIKRLALAGAAALPVISMVVAPPAAHAASCIPNLSSCTQSAQCCSLCCKNVGGGVNQCKPGGGACLP
jgi:hypothetical protein